MNRNCIFCQQSGQLSKEHLWPRWMSKLLKLPNSTNHISDSFVGKGKGPRSLQSRIERQGDVTTKKFRVVCRVCNSGWMGDLEQRVKPIIKRLLNVNGEKELSAEEAAVLATWTAAKVMVAEFSDRDTVLTPDFDRFKMYQESKIPDYYSVYVGVHGSNTHATYIRHSCTISRTMAGPKPSIPPECGRNVQVVTFLVGALVFHVVSKRVEGLSDDELKPPGGLAQLWPILRSDYDLSSLRVLNIMELNELAYWLDKDISHPRVKYGGEFKRDQT